MLRGNRDHQMKIRSRLFLSELLTPLPLPLLVSHSRSPFGTFLPYRKFGLDTWQDQLTATATTVFTLFFLLCFFSFCVCFPFHFCVLLCCLMLSVALDSLRFPSPFFCIHPFSLSLLIALAWDGKTSSSPLSQISFL